MKRHCFPLNGTPEFCESGQLHHIIEKDIADRIRDNSLRSKDWTKRPGAQCKKHSGIAYTPKGYRRGPTQYIIAQSFAEVWHAFPQSRCLAAHIRAGSVSKELAAMLVDQTAEEIMVHVQELVLLMR